MWWTQMKEEQTYWMAWLNKTGVSYTLAAYVLARFPCRILAMFIFSVNSLDNKCFVARWSLACEPCLPGQISNADYCLVSEQVPIFNLYIERGSIPWKVVWVQSWYWSSVCLAPLCYVPIVDVFASELIVSLIHAAEQERDRWVSAIKDQIKKAHLEEVW